MSYDLEQDPDRTKITVVGVTFCNDEDQVPRQQLLCGAYDNTNDDDDIEVELVPELDNSYDRNAIAVWIRRPKKHAGRVGYLPMGENLWIGKALAAGTLGPSVGALLWCGGAGTGVGMAVFVDRPEESMAGGPDQEIPEEGEDLESMLAEYD